VIAQGSIDALVSGRRKIAVGSDDPARAASLLARLRGVESASVDGDSVRVSLAPNGGADREVVTAIVRELLDAGLSIDRVTPLEATLEERFLNLTSRFEEDR
jgi:hypothetical protein